MLYLYTWVVPGIKSKAVDHFPEIVFLLGEVNFISKSIELTLRNEVGFSWEARLAIKKKKRELHLFCVGSPLSQKGWIRHFLSQPSRIKMSLGYLISEMKPM